MKLEYCYLFGIRSSTNYERVAENCILEECSVDSVVGIDDLVFAEFCLALLVATSIAMSNFEEVRDPLFQHNFEFFKYIVLVDQILSVASNHIVLLCFVITILQ